MLTECCGGNSPGAKGLNSWRLSRIIASRELVTVDMQKEVSLLVGFFLLLLSGCGKELDQDTLRIGFSQCCDDPWRDVMNREILREVAASAGLSVDIRVAANNNERQIGDIRSLVAQGIDVLLVSPNESGPLTPVIEEVYRSGIPVILIDRKVESPLYTAYIGADNYQVGRVAGSYVADQHREGAEILMIELPQAISPGVERSRGFRAAIAANPALSIVESMQANGVEDINRQLPGMLQRHPGVGVIFGHTDLFAELAYIIAAGQGRADSLSFVGIDGIPGTGRGIEAVEDGILNASILYPTGGAEAVRLIRAVTNDLPFEKENRLETIVIDPGNATILHNQMKQVNNLQREIDEQVSRLDDLRAIYQSQRTYILFLAVSLLLVLVFGISAWRSLQSRKAAVRDLEQKNEEIRGNERALRKLSEEVNAATQAKVNFFTNVSHELRTPLTLILGFVEDLLPTSKLNRAQEQSVAHIRRNAHRLLELVNQLMDFRKLESGSMDVRARQLDLVDYVRQIMSSFQPTAARRGIDLRLITRAGEVPVWIDAPKFDKVLFNLLSNAFKFTPDGGRVHLVLQTDERAGRVELAVEDNGEGMTSEETGHVFEAFFQGGSGRNRGTGLGLSLSRSLVELQGGTIGATSRKGEGSRFTVHLPLGRDHLTDDQVDTTTSVGYLPAECPSSDLEELPALESGQGGARAANPEQLLIIEDNEELQAFLRFKLSPLYQLLQATDGDTGLRTALDYTPDLIICDVSLPGIDGIELTRRLRGDLRTSHIPIFLLTARSFTEQRLEGIQAGADAYLTKPFNIQLLTARIAAALRNREILRESFATDLTTTAGGADSELNLPDNVSDLDRDFLLRFTRYVAENHGDQDFNISTLSRELGLSRSQLYRKVKALLGESVGGYVERIRLERAEKLLAEGTLSVADIAYAVGYSSPDYFARVFKSKYDVPPSKFQPSAGN